MSFYKQESSNASFFELLGCTYVNPGTSATELCNGGWCYADSNCATDCCDCNNHDSQNHVCVTDNYTSC